MAIFFGAFVAITIVLALTMCLLLWGSTLRPEIAKVSLEFPNAEAPRRMDVTVLLPYQNNANTITSVLNAIINHSVHLRIHLILINNCSTDQTEELIKKRLAQIGDFAVTFLKYSEQSSKAHAIASGLSSVGTDLVALVDADVVLESCALVHLARFLTLTGADASSGFILCDSRRVTNLASWDKCLSHGTIRLGRYNLGLCPNIPGQVVVARRRSVNNYDSFHSFLEDLALSNMMYGRRLRVSLLPEIVATEHYPTTFGFLLRQRIRWLIGNFENLVPSIRNALHLGLKGAFGILLHMPIYHGFPTLISLWLLLAFFRPWPSIGFASLLAGLYGIAAWNGAKQTSSRGTIVSLIFFVLCFPWIHLLAWVAGIPLYVGCRVLKIDIHGMKTLYMR